MSSAILQKWATRLLKHVKAQVKVVNPHNTQLDQDRSYIIVVNHNSLYDIPATLVSFPNVDIRMVMKKELFSIPVFGGGVKSAEFLYVDRGNRAAALTSLKQIGKAIQSGITIWIAPEGTRSLNKKLGEFKKGAFQLAFTSNAILIPLGLRNTDIVCPAKTYKFTFNQTIELHIGKPIDTLDYNKKDMDSLIEQVRSEIGVLSNQELA